MQLNSEKSFSIYYDTPETKDHTIDAEVLGNSITSLAKAIKTANKIINGENSEFKVSVKAHKEGSFAVEFSAWFNNGGKDVLDIIGLSLSVGTPVAGTVFGVVKALKGQKITARVVKGNGKSVLKLEDNSEIECSTDIERIVTNPDFRGELDKVIYTPIKESEGVIKIKDETGKTVDLIPSEDAEAFKKIPNTILEEIDIKEMQIDVAFTQVNFESSKGWRCRIGADDEETSVLMKDDGFLQRINDRKENFVKGDVFEVKLEKTTKIKTSRPPKVDYKIIRVIRHRADNERKII